MTHKSLATLTDKSRRRDSGRLEFEIENSFFENSFCKSLYESLDNGQSNFDLQSFSTDSFHQRLLLAKDPASVKTSLG